MTQRKSSVCRLFPSLRRRRLGIISIYCSIPNPHPNDSHHDDEINFHKVPSSPVHIDGSSVPPNVEAPDSTKKNLRGYGVEVYRLCGTSVATNKSVNNS